MVAIPDHCGLELTNSSYPRIMWWVLMFVIALIIAKASDFARILHSVNSEDSLNDIIWGNLSYIVATFWYEQKNKQDEHRYIKI